MKVEVYPKLWVGDDKECEKISGLPNWYIIHACKDPCHRRILGYKGRGAPKDSPEYLVAFRSTGLYLNLVDAEDIDYIPKEIIDKAVSVLDSLDNLENKFNILIHCNIGGSRAPTIAFLCLSNKLYKGMSYKEAINKFLEIFPEYCPGTGMKLFARKYFNEYSSR